MKKNKNREIIFFVLEYKRAPGHYYLGSGKLIIPNVLYAKRYNSKKEALKNKPNNSYRVRKIIVEVHRD